MGDGFSAVTNDLRRAAGSAESAAEIAGGVRLAEALAHVGQALPGSRSAASADTLGEAWRGRLRGWSRDAEEYAAHLRTAAERYEASDGRAAASLGTFGGFGRPL